MYLVILLLITISCNTKSLRDSHFSKSSTKKSQRISDKNSFRGFASFYAEKYHGRKTANGETFNMNALTAAHKTLPFNTKLRVTYLKTNMSVIVRINDRGPFVGNRILDLSKAAAIKINLFNDGVGEVLIEIL